MKFKPGFTVNFISRYAQVTDNKFRYFKNKEQMISGKQPIIEFHKREIEYAKPYQVNKWSYLKPGTAIAKSKKEDHLFDSMFEVVLKDDEYSHNKKSITNEKKSQSYDSSSSINTNSVFSESSHETARFKQSREASKTISKLHMRRTLTHTGKNSLETSLKAGVKPD